MLNRLTVLCENSVEKPVQAIGEHGFSCLVETDNGAFLFDTGQGLGLLHNAELLNVSLSDLQGVILSHGHFDHTGGVQQLLSQAGPLPVYGHPELFRERFWVGKFEQRPNGIPFSRDQLEKLGARFDLSREFREISPGLWLTGEVPRLTPFEKVDKALHYKDRSGTLIPDQIEDDCSLVIESELGLVVLLGCAHAGLANILHHVVEMMGNDRIYAVLGGMHLAPLSDEPFDQTVAALKQYKVNKIGVGHCSGKRRSADLYAHFPAETMFLSVGSGLSIPSTNK
jgi:7,8-dihydropterin-6-yl-methyl-4-(beta-D-ribofuranosyl)aminobenzene 5'-phosphate synthase